MKKTKLTRNFTLKIMSVFIGFLIWFIVVNVDNPVSSKSITIAGENVELQNTACLLYTSLQQMPRQKDIRKGASALM